VFLVDTLRADRLGCYGDGEARSPEFDALAREGLRVERALSTADWTLPAHASLFTSTDVSTHGVGSVRSRLPRDLPTLAETLQHRGYRTLAVTNGGFLDPQFGLARGFQRYFALDLERESIETTVGRAVRLIEAAKGAPFFLFFHTYQVHDYHRHRKEDIRIFAPRLRRQYDDQVTRTDAAFGVLRAELRRLGLADTTALLLTSDHGEILDDGSPSETAQRFGHTSPYLHDNETRIPLVLLDPHRPGRGAVLDRPVSIVDVAPTVLAVLGLRPNRAFRGMDFSGMAGARIPADRLRVAEEPFTQSLALERDGKKLIVRPARSSLRAMWVDLPYGRLDPVSAYDMRSDPHESADLIPGPRVPEFDGLFAEASRSVAERFPGAIVLRIPPSDTVVSIQLDFDSGVRRWQFYSGGEPSLIEVSESGHGITATVPPSAGPGWMVIEPRRRRDGFVCSLRGAPPVILGDGEAAPRGETRRPWSAMLETNLSRNRSAVLLTVSKLDPYHDDAENARALPAENIAQLRSLGYVNFQTGDSAARAAPLPGVGSGVFRVRWQPESSR
jgi:arylsulfatase A-like enzyme